MQFIIKCTCEIALVLLWMCVCCMQSPGTDPLVDEAPSPAVSILQSTERVATVFVNTLTQNRSSVTISRPNLGA